MAEEKKTGIGGIPGIYWRYIAALAIASVVIFAWNSFFNFGPPPHYTINYSQFMEQLSAGNIKSVSIKKLLVSGEFVKAVNIQFQGEKKPANVKYFQTDLPSFQGDKIILKDETAGTFAEVIPSCSAILHAFTVIKDEKEFNVIDSYQSEADFRN